MNKRAKINKGVNKYKRELKNQFYENICNCK